MLRIRLSQTGKRDDRKYRIVVSERRSKREGKVVDRLGHFDPKTERLTIDKKLLEAWIAKGAQPSESLRKLLK